MKKVKYSILVPVYNKLKYLQEYFKFILNQTYSNYETIAVDDSSTDGSYEFLTGLEKEYFNLHVYQNEEKQGLGENRNTLLSKSNGEYVLFIDPDDYIEIDLLNQIDKNNDNLDIIRFQNIIEPVTKKQKANEENKDKYRYSVKSTGVINGEEALLSWCLGERKINTFPWTYAYKKELFKDVSYPKTSILEDFAVTPYLIAKSKRIKSIDYVGYHYLLYDDSLSKQKIDYEFAKNKLLMLKNMILLSTELIEKTEISEESKKFLLMTFGIDII